MDIGAVRLLEQHIDNLLGRAVAEELAVFALVVGDAMALHQGDKVVLVIARERRDAKTRILRQKIRGRSVKIGEVGAPTAGNPDFLPHLGIALEQERATAAPSRRGGAHETGRPGADDDNVEILHA